MSNSTQKTSVARKLSVQLLREHPDRIYVFGDNLLRRGRAGQAVIRDEPNAFGVPTKRLPTMATEAFFSDQDDEREAVVQALRELFVLAKTREVVFPKAGLGTGLAQMARHSPVIYRQMCEILQEHFGFEQPQEPAA